MAQDGPRHVCIVGDYDSRRYEYRSMANYRCGGGRHRHFTRLKVRELIKRGEMEWVGLPAFDKMARFVNPKTWAARGQNVRSMQMVPGGLLIQSVDKQRDRRAAAKSPVRHIEVNS